MSPPETASSAWQPRPAYVNYVIGLIFVVSAINVCDRTIVAVLVDDIRAELALDDRQMGLVMGFAFSVTYLLASVPIARLADRRARALTLLPIILA
ncbi:MAG: hypothetical protein ACKO4A_05890 [Gammaproteobacteria bacterium]